MSIIFRGDTRWQQVKQTEWTIDSWGLDRARVLFRGPSTGKKAFEDRLVRWENMPNYPGMKLESWNSVIITDSYPGVEKMYVGFKSGALPPAKPVDGYSTQTAQGAGTDTATGRKVSGSFTYKASRTTWTWFETTLPNPVTPRYASVQNPVDPFDSITSYSIQDDTGRRTNSVPLSAFTAVFNSLVKRVMISDYVREQIQPNALWACSCVADYVIV
jgi:hypothetical protein